MVQDRQLQNPDARVALDTLEEQSLLSDYADSYLGLGTGDFEKFGRTFWEFPQRTDHWSYLQCSLERPGYFEECRIWLLGTTLKEGPGYVYITQRKNS